MRFLVLMLLCLGECIMAYAQDYAVTKIPAALLKDANVVKRKEEIRYEVTGGNRGRYYQKIAYTILNEQGDRWASFTEGYDKLTSIETFEGSLFDAAGRKIRSLKKSEIRDGSGSDDNLADDSRIKWHSFFYKAYPFTVEYEVEVYSKGTMFTPSWIPQERNIMSVETATLVIKTPENNPVRYKMYNYPGQPATRVDDGIKWYTWQVKDLPAIKAEYAPPTWRELTTSVFLATEKFMLEDYTGSYASWNDFGRFVYDLKKGKDQLPEDVKRQVHELTAGITDEKEKVKRLYEYMQQNTHYISIQLGIGGWQPFDATYVANRKYGDCKALSNFMSALLKEAGIRSLYTLITMGDNNDYLVTDLPSSQFNHAILMVPLGKDTTWLECTSQTLPAGYLSGGTSNRYALVVDENGGVLVRTPHYGLLENLQTRKISAIIDADGYLRANIKTSYGAIQQDDLHHMINNLSRDKLMERLKEDLDLATYDVKSFEYKEHKQEVPVIDESIELTAENYATVTGKRLFVHPNIFTRSHRKLTVEETRRFDIVLSFAFNDVDTVEIKLPDGYTPESIPQDVKLESQFGKYRATVKLDGTRLLYYRSYEHYSGRFPAAQYAELVKFYETIYKADRNKVVLVKKD